MRKLITLLFILISLSSLGQYSFDKEKYWIYRERLKNFMVRSHGTACAGCDNPALNRQKNDVLYWGDSPWMIGYWMGTLAMEYRLLRNAGFPSSSPEVMQTKEDLYGVIQSINRLDGKAEISFNCATEFLPENINGFLISDDVPANFAEDQSIIDGLNDGLVPPPDDYTIKCINSGFTEYKNPGREASQDHLIGLFIGLALVKKCIGDIDVNENWNYTPFLDEYGNTTTKFVQEVQIISQRIINYLNSNGWIYRNKCTEKCVIGIYNEKNPDACVSLDPSEACTFFVAPGFTYCCEEGGAIAIPQAIGFAAANQFIQGTTNDPILADLTSKWTHNDSWNMAINDGNRLVMTLVALGNIWKTGTYIQLVPQTVHLCLPFDVSWCHCCWKDETYTINVPQIITYSSTTGQITDHLVNASKGNNHWEHLYLLHKFLYGDGNNSSSISDIYYQCLLDAAPCRGWDGSGVNVEWGWTDRLGGDRCGSATSPCDGNADARIDYMFYFNLFNSVQSQGSYSPIPINNLALNDIIKSNYTEYDKKNFHAAHNITAQDYEITELSTKGKGRVNFAAGNKIILGNGFKVTNGGYFHGYIDPAISAMNCFDPPSQTDCGFAGKTSSDPDTVADLDSIIVIITVQDSFTNVLPCPVDTFFPHAKDFDSTATSFYWDFGNGQISNLESPAILYSSSGSYTLTLVTVSPSKTDSFSMLLYVPDCDSMLRTNNQQKKHFANIDESKSNKTFPQLADPVFTIIPNPSNNGIFNITGNTIADSHRDLKINVTNILGEIIFSQKSEFKFPLSIDISKQSKGFYFVQISNGKELSVQKIIYQ